VGRITKALPGELKRLLAWAGQWNPLAHALVVAFGLDLIADVFFGNADLNGAVFVVTFVAVLAASIVLQRRADTRRYDALPFSPGAPMDSDGVELELVAFAWTDPDRKEQKEMIWARPVDDDLFRIRSVPMVADGINRHDLVRCVEAEGRLHVAEVTERGGHRTVRFSANADLDLDLWETVMETLPSGLSLAWARGSDVCIDVHPEDDVDELTTMLARLADAGALTWYEASGPPLVPG